MRLLLLLLLLHTVPATLVPPPNSFNVLNYGAVAHGKTDNAPAFQTTWKKACEYPGRSRMWIPRGTFLLGEVSFNGPCRGTTTFLIKGTLKAPTHRRRFFTDTWIGFRYVDFLTVKGGGFLDGQGHSAWPFNDCRTNSHCKPLPPTLRLDFVRNGMVKGIHSYNSKSSHINLFACENINITKIRLQAPQHSPNTDGIRIGASTNVEISNAVISTGDDCISMVSGSRWIDIRDVQCGPGHGISVGSLGRSRSRHVESVKGIHVRNCTFIGSENGVRIKTWAPSLYSVASRMLFEDILIENSRNPIVIDQNYCPSLQCDIQSNSAVQIKDVTFKNIKGISRSIVAVKLQCSGALPCKNVKLIDINLSYGGPGGTVTALCNNVVGSSSYGELIPPSCL